MSAVAIAESIHPVTAFVVGECLRRMYYIGLAVALGLLVDGSAAVVAVAVPEDSAAARKAATVAAVVVAACTRSQSPAQIPLPTRRHAAFAHPSAAQA